MIDDIDMDNLQFKTLDLNIVKDKIPTFSSQKLCEMIVCDRYFGCYKEIAIMCMSELSNRRALGDNFLFENYIDDALKQLPVLNIKISNISDILKQAISNRKK